MNPYISAAAIAASILCSCEKELDFKYHDIESITVIEGELTPEGAKVRITYTTPMDEPMDKTPLTDADVTLRDLTTGETRILHPDSEGYFRDNTPGIDRHEYSLTVARDGHSYEAYTTMYSPSEIRDLSFSWIRMPYDDVAVLKGEYLDDEATEGDCYWIKIFRNGKIYSWGEADDRSSLDGVLNFVTMTTRRDTEQEDEESVLYDGDEITVSICRISRPMHDYLEALQNDSNGPAMFEGDFCLGYFMATSPVSETIVFHPDQITESE